MGGRTDGASVPTLRIDSEEVTRTPHCGGMPQRVVMTSSGTGAVTSCDCLVTSRGY